ncbi:MAG: hypothetical protein AB8B53_10945 [Flavobacteriales bacterium]
MPEERMAMVRSAIDNIMNDVLQQAYQHSMNYPQDSDQLNVLIRAVSEDNESLINRLHQVKVLNDKPLIDLELNSITKTLKKKSLEHLSALQKLKEKNSPKT